MERVNPRFHMGKQMERIPISKLGSPYRNGSPFPNGDRSVTNPFPNRVHAHLGIEVKITIWECFTYGDHRFYMVITVRKWAGRLEYSHMGNPRFRIEFVSIWGLTYTPSRQKKSVQAMIMVAPCHREKVLLRWKWIWREVIPA
jgi:hypothetical protein